MRLSSVFAISAVFLVAAVLSLVAARFSAVVIEETSQTAVHKTLEKNGMTWAEVDADGLQIFLAGTAPSEAARFRALSIAGTAVDAARLIDQMLVEESAGLAPPRFSMEILRNDSGLSLIGLIPAGMDRDVLRDEIGKVVRNTEVIDLLETADYPMPESWEDAVDFAVRALGTLPRSKISVDADRVAVTAMADSEEHKREIENDLAREVPEGLRLSLDISAPRPVIAPFTLRFLIRDGVARFDACSADTEEARDTILSAAGKAGLRDRTRCSIGLGVPSPKWGQAAAQAIAALDELGGGTITMSDADISLVAEPGVPQNRFDRIAGELESALPDVFALHAVLPEPEDGDSEGEDPEFVVTLSPEGTVQIRGRLGSERMRDLIDGFAKARFSSEAVHTAARVVEGLPGDWSMRTLAGIEALSYLSNGAVTVRPNSLSVAGNTGRSEAASDISAFLSEKLGEGAQFEIDVTYREELDPVASIPTPEECEARITQILSERKIDFEPGSETIDPDGARILDDIADVLRDCGEIRMEIGGHTDSQGREVMNQQLSQARARAVLDELRARRILTSSFTAKGYGESEPIADNDTEEGREANRRIEFRLIRPEPAEEDAKALERLAIPFKDVGASEGETQEGADNEQD